MSTASEDGGDCVMKFGFLLFPELEELDFVGPWEIIGVWGEFYEGPEHRLTVSQSGDEVLCAKGLRIVPDCSFDRCPPLDYLLIPGGWGTRKEVANQELVEFVRKQARTCKQVLSVCTGAFILQAAGLLKGKRATTHWRSLDRLREFQEVSVIEQRLVRDGNIWTAAGISAGIDLALAFVADQGGEEVAGKVQLHAEYYPANAKYGSAHLTAEAPDYIKAPL
jgi:transcriptional regulator GlxA family with amidase domain